MLQMTPNQQPLRGVRTTGTVFILGLLIALLSVGLTACSYRSASISSAQSQALLTDPPAGVPQPKTPVIKNPIQPQVQQCGFVQGYGALKTVPIDTGRSKQVENCFWQAFQTCRPATLVFITNSLHATFTHTFTIQNSHGNCSILDATKFGSVTNSASPATVYSCAGLKRYPRALYFLACGKDGTIIVLGF